jgi:hypothetical protein
MSKNVIQNTKNISSFLKKSALCNSSVEGGFNQVNKKLDSKRATSFELQVQFHPDGLWLVKFTRLLCGGLAYIVSGSGLRLIFIRWLTDRSI